MNAARLYLISYYFAPLGRADGVNRALMVKNLSRLGWKIDVLSCSNPHAFLRSFQQDPTLLGLIPEDVKVHRVPSKYWGPVGQLAYLAGIVPDPFLNWRRPALGHAIASFHEPGIVYAIVPPTVNLLVASALAEERGWPLVIDFRDNVRGIPSRALGRVAGMVASTKRSLDEMSSMYCIDAPGTVFYNGSPGPACDHPARSIGDRFRIVYTGLMGMETDPAMLLDTLDDLEDEEPALASTIDLGFIGPRNYYTRIFLERRLGGRRRFMGYLPYAEAHREMSESDACFVSIRGSKKSYCIPSKIFQYMSTGAPVLAFGPEGEMGEFIEKQGIGLFADCCDRKARVRALAMMAGDRELLADMRKASADAAARFSLEVQTQNLDLFLRAIPNRDDRRPENGTR